MIKKKSENSNKKTGDDPSLASCKPFHYDTKTFNMSILSQTYRPKQNQNWARKLRKQCLLKYM